MFNKPPISELNKLQKLDSTRDQRPEDITIQLHFFIGTSDWYIAEYDGEDTFYGFVILNGDTDCAEWGPISYSELKDCKIYPKFSINGQSVVSKFPMEIEYDRYFTPKAFKEIAKEKGIRL